MKTSAVVLTALGGLVVAGFVALFIRELPAVRRELRILRM